MSTQSVNITGEVVTWARLRLGLSETAIAEAMDTTAEAIRGWEADTSSPTFRQAQRLAHTLRIPFGYLFLSSRPGDPVPLPDLRTVGGGVPEATPDLIDVLNDILRKQHWYGEFVLENGAAPQPFVGKFSLRDEVPKIAADIRDTLSINDDLRRQCANWTEFLTAMVRLAEAVGILVMRSGTVAGNTHRPLQVSEFRGFAIADVFAPTIFINSKDAKVAQIFTFAHELAHIWIGESGISNPNFKKSSADQVNAIEQFCNRIAAEVLVPAGGFRRNWNAEQSIQANTYKLSALYRVSRFVILRQAVDLGVISLHEYLRRLKDEYDKFIGQKKEDSRGNYYNSLFARNSYRLTATLSSALADGQVLYHEAARLLGVRIPILENLAAKL
jgi:Zn-dependent peptidase ImmA (M78 family)/DNA-binding XRE family transcriptional regulator